MLNQALGLIGCAFEYLRIGDHHFGTGLEHPFECLSSIPCLRDHFDVRFILQQTPQSLPQQDMVVH